MPAKVPAPVSGGDDYSGPQSWMGSEACILQVFTECLGLCDQHGLSPSLTDLLAGGETDKETSKLGVRL